MLLRAMLGARLMGARCSRDTADSKAQEYDTRAARRVPLRARMRACRYDAPCRLRFIMNAIYT